jgi:chromatin segregation and condensation protein Rec8/ScpA/Scc1 (kleisin family)
VLTAAAYTRPTLRERADFLVSSVPADAWRSFYDLLGADVPTAVATFLALLALVRQGVLLVRQDGACGALELRRGTMLLPPLASLALDD